jgi:hypothetical protein
LEEGIETVALAIPKTPKPHHMKIIYFFHYNNILLKMT